MRSTSRKLSLLVITLFASAASLVSCKSKETTADKRESGAAMAEEGPRILDRWG